MATVASIPEKSYKVKITYSFRSGLIVSDDYSFSGLDDAKKFVSSYAPLPFLNKVRVKYDDYSVLDGVYALLNAVEVIKVYDVEEPPRPVLTRIETISEL